MNRFFRAFVLSTFVGGLIFAAVLARAADGEISIPGFGVVRLDDIADQEMSPEELENNLRLAESQFGGGGPSVSARDGAVFFTGETSAAGFDALAEFAADESISVLAVDSLGGEVFWGMKIGELVFARGWDVRVDGHCFSACANYIFPAGKNKIISAGAVVGWHGSARQGAVLAAREGISEKEHFARTLIPAMIAGFPADAGMELTMDMMRGALMQEWGAAQARKQMEAEFFKRIEADPDSAVYGLLPESGASEKFGAAGGAGGWTFRAADMAKFGIKNVRWLGEGDYPPPNKLALLGLLLLEVKE